MNGKPAIKFIVRTIAVLTIGIMVSVVFLSNVGSYSWFNNMGESSMSVTAAVTEDIIESIEIIEESWNSQDQIWTKPYLKIRKNPNFEKLPILFFEVEGAAAEYILHINPVRLNTDDYYLIPIDSDINAQQYSNLGLDINGNVSGTIFIKYLNEFINEGIELEISNRYLMHRFMEGISREEVRIVAEGSTVKPMAMNKMTLRTLKVKSEPEPNDVTVKAIISLAELVEWKGIDSLFNNGKLSEEALNTIGLDLIADQEILLDIIYPGLKEYVEELKGYIRRLRTELEDKNTRLVILDEQLASLESQYAELLEENARLTEEIESMLLKPLPSIPQSPATGGDQPPELSGGGTSTDEEITTEDIGEGDTGDTAENNDADNCDEENGVEDVGDGIDCAGNGDEGNDDPGDANAGNVDTGDIDTVDTDTGTVDNS